MSYIQNPAMSNLERKLALIREFMPETPTLKFITITLPPKYYRRNAQGQIKAFSNVITNILENFVEKGVIVAELTLKGNIHYHGLVELRKQGDNDRVYHLGLIDSMKRVSRFDIQNVKEYQKVTDYIMKDTELTESITGLNPIIRYNNKRDTILKYTSQKEDKPHSLDSSEITINTISLNIE